MLTQLERFYRTMAGERTDTPLVYAKFTPDLSRRILEATGARGEDELFDRYGLFRPLHLDPDAAHVTPDTARYYDAIPEGAFFDANGVMHVPGSMYHFTHMVSPLQSADTPDELAAYPYPDPEMRPIAELRAEVRAAHAEGRAVTGFVGHMYESAWQVRGYERFLEDMLDAPENCRAVLEPFVRLAERRARALALAGVDYLRTGDDVANQRAMMFRPALWREIIKPSIARVCAAAKDVRANIDIWYHSDGNVEPIVPDLIDMGVTILNPVQPECMPLARAQERFGGRVCFDGAIGTQTTMPFGTPEDVREAAREAIRVTGGRGLILSPTHVLEPEVPVENVLALFEEARPCR